MSNTLPDLRGYFGAFGGRFVPETLMAPLLELTAAYHALRHDPKFKKEPAYYFKNFVGRPTPLMYARRLASSGYAQSNEGRQKKEGRRNISALPCRDTLFRRRRGVLLHRRRSLRRVEAGTIRRSSSARSPPT